MKVKTLFILAMILAAAVPASADKKKKQQDRAMLERMDAVACGAKQRGLAGLGSLWGSVGITHVNSDEKLCARYLLRTDDMEYEIQPTDKKHPPVLPVGQEVVFKIKKDHMDVKCPEGTDKKTRTYLIVGMKPTNPDTGAQNPSANLEKP